MNLYKEMIFIEGMSCGHCINAVTEALENTKGVFVDGVIIGRALVRYDNQRVDRTSIIQAIEGLGYEVVQGEPTT